MSILNELISIIRSVDVPVQTIAFTEKPPDEYIVLTPLSDPLGEYADNMPQQEVNEIRISLYTRNNFLKQRDRLTRCLLNADFTITDRRFIEFEPDTRYYHYSMDVEKASNFGVDT